jgi:hypothetical protein
VTATKNKPKTRSQVKRPARGATKAAGRDLGAGRRRRKRAGKRLNSHDHDLAATAALDLLCLGLAGLRLNLASDHSWKPTGQPIGIEAVIIHRLKSVPAVDGLRACFAADELARLKAEVTTALDRKVGTIIDGLRDADRLGRQLQIYRGLATEVSGLVRQTRPLAKGEDPIEARASGQMPVEKVFPSKNKIRAEIARRMRINERTVRHMEKRATECDVLERLERAFSSFRGDT